MRSRSGSVSCGPSDIPSAIRLFVQESEGNLPDQFQLQVGTDQCENAESCHNVLDEMTKSFFVVSSMRRKIYSTKHLVSLLSADQAGQPTCCGLATPVCVPVP